MKNLLLQYEKPLNGPWLISSDSLRELDTIIDEYWKKFESRRLRLLRNATNKEMGLYAPLGIEHTDLIKQRLKNFREESIYSRRDMTVAIILDDKGERLTIAFNSFEMSLREPLLLNRKPAGFIIEMFSGDIVFRVAADNNKDGIEIFYEPIDEPVAQELYTVVYDWARKIRHQSILEGIWGKAAKLKLWIFSFYSLFLYLFFIGTQMTNSADTREQLLALYDHGINETNVVEAVKLLALLQRGEQFTPVETSPWLSTAIGFLVYLLVVLIIRPRVELEIGKGREAILYWRIYKWAMLFVPLFFLRDVFLSYLADLVKSFYSLVP